MSVKQYDSFKALRDFLCSLKLTIVTLLLLAATSVIGTIVPQNLPLDQYRHLYGETATTVLRALQLFDMYHSWWFLGLLGLFAVNLLACSLRRLPVVWRTVSRPVLFAEESLLKTLPNRRVLQTPLPPAEVNSRLENLLRQRFAKPKITERGEQTGFFSQRRPYARFSVYLTHLSILFILLGAIIGSVWGFKSFVTIVEGKSVQAVPAPKGDQEINLGFSLRCDDFSISYYEGSSRPREYRSVLTVLENGVEVPGFIRIPVLVNHPLRYRGLMFYQSSYGMAEMPKFRFLASIPGGETEVELVGRPGQAIKLPDGGSFQLVDYTPSFRDWGAVALLEILTPGGKRLGAMAPEHGPQDLPEAEGYKFRLLGSEERYYTGLQVAKDPGVPVVWAGCLLLILGSLSAFFLSHQRLWVVTRPSSDGCEVRIGATAHRNQQAFVGQFEQLCSEISEELKVVPNFDIDQVSQEGVR